MSSVESRAHLPNMGIGLEGMSGVHSSSVVPEEAPALWLPALGLGPGFRATIWCQNSFGQEAYSCCPCLPLTTAELFLICRRCSDPGAIKYLTDVRIAIRPCVAEDSPTACWLPSSQLFSLPWLGLLGPRCNKLCMWPHAQGLVRWL